ncbi:hypothetical protein ABPG77_007329 [Micractinium sp. CCAP 211/92]
MGQQGSQRAFRPAALATVLLLLALALPGSPLRRWASSNDQSQQTGGAAQQRASTKLAAAGVASSAAAAGGAAQVQQQRPGDDVLQRFRWAVRYVNATSPRGVQPIWRCPSDSRVGGRPKRHVPHLIGTTCEPWMSRNAITLLHELLLPGTAKGLEWSTGSSTTWLLSGHVSSLVSIEHHQKWADNMQAAIERIFGAEFARERWQLQHIPADPPDSQSSEDPQVFAEYAKAAFVPDSEAGTFDFVSIDGRARVACFPRALQLLKPHGGVLVLDNAERPHYRKGVESVPRHWLRYAAVNEEDTTIVWVSCLPGLCGRGSS